MKALRPFLIVAVITLIFLPTYARSGSGDRPAWPKLPAQLTGVYVATSSETIPLFPRELPKYRDAGKTDYWDEPYPLHGTIRVFASDGWKTIPDFPQSGNHCGEGLFMIRWRTSNPDVGVASNVGDNPEPSRNDPKKAKTGNFGYMLGTNCDQPLFKFARGGNKNESNLVDIHYELRFWQAAP